ncbi:MAG: hypothetical protein KJ587_10360 [Alphaproteobacteria bacterium]|nr:hypothetical protein [Alphaproteobacteria bacterium]
MSIRSLPLIIFAFIFYNIVVLLGASDTGNAESILRTVFFSLPSFRSGAAEGADAVYWTFTWGDLIILVTMLLLFVEILKATYTSTASLLDHGLSMLVFIACLVEFLLIDAAYTSVFFLLMVATLIDVVAGYTIGIRVARRDIGFGNMGE